MRRLLLLLLLLVVLAVAVLVTVQVVLMSDLPRRVVVAQLRDRLGLDVQIDHLRASWSGEAVARGIRVTLPLDDTPFLEARSLELKHTALLRILFTLGVDIEHIVVDDPLVRLVQRPEGYWNLQQVQEVLAANLAGDDEPRDPSGPLPIPALDLRHARLEIDRLDRPVVELAGVQITGQRRPPLAYLLSLDIPRVGGAEAHFSRAAPFTHEVHFDFAPERQLVDELVGDELPGPSPASRLAGMWTGRITSRELRGTLQLHDASVAAGRLRGSAQLSARTDSPTFVLEPTGLALTVDPVLAEPLYMVGGRLLVTERQVRLRDVRLAGFSGRMRANGELDLETLTGELGASWEGLVLPAGFNHAGEIDVQLTRRGPARRVVEAIVGTRGRSELGNWDGTVQLHAAGETYADLAGTLRAQEMRYEMRGQRYRFADVLARFTTDERAFHLTRFELGKADEPMHLVGSGTFDWVERSWSARFTGQDVLLPAPAPSLGRLRFAARGDAAGIEVSEAEVLAAGVEVEAVGRYVFADEEPLQAQVRLRQVPIQFGDHDAMPLVQARNVVGTLEAHGTLRPLALQAEGELLAEAVRVHRDTLGDITLNVGAKVDEQLAVFQAQAIEWLGGEWQLRARYGMAEGQARVFVDARDIDLTLADRLLASPLGLEVGRADLSLWAADVQGGPRGMRMVGAFELRDLARLPATAERVTGRLDLRHGQARVLDLLAVEGDGRVTGEAVVNLDRPSELRFDVSLDGWPLRLLDDGRLDSWVTGRVRGDVDAAGQTGEAEAELALRLASAGLDLGELSLAAGLSGSMLRLHSLEGSPLQGRIRGQGAVDLANPWQTVELEVSWADLYLRGLDVAVLERMTGTLGGSLQVTSTRDRRALGPVRANVELVASDASFRDLPIGNGEAVAYLDRDRVVLQNLMVEAMGGQVGAWGRMSEQEGERFVFASGWVTDLDMGMISETLRPDEAPLLGRLSADVSFSTSLENWRNIFGTGSLTLRESDIATIPLISVLYDLANIVLIGQAPEGRGQAQFRFEGGAALIERFFYQNRGLTIRLTGRVEDMFQGLESPFSGVASLSLAPLPDVEFLEVLNEAFTALQSDMTTARLTGRINAPDPPQVVPFRGVWDAVRRVMGRSQRE